MAAAAAAQSFAVNKGQNAAAMLTAAVDEDIAYRAYLAAQLQALIATAKKSVPEAVMQNAKAIMPKATDEEIQEYYDRYLRETGQNKTVDPLILDFEKNESYNDKNDQQIAGADGSSTLIKCRNGKLEGKNHPVTGVLFVKKQVGMNGTLVSVVVPAFESYYDAQIPKNMLEARDRKQFAECNQQLKRAIAADPELRELFTEEQLIQIENGETPEGFAWHHDAGTGKMQLVNKDEHKATGHTGGRAIWGGGSVKRIITRSWN